MNLLGWALVVLLWLLIAFVFALLLASRLGHAFSRRREPCPPPRGNDLRLHDDQVVDLIRTALAPGVRSGPESEPRLVLWDDAGAQALLHLDSVAARFVEGAVVVSADFETDQTGIAPLIVTFALAPAGEEAGLVAVSDELARGHPLLVSRWGATFRETIWAALLATARNHAQAQGMIPTGLHVVDGGVLFACEAAAALDAGVVPARMAERAGRG